MKYINTLPGQKLGLPSAKAGGIYSFHRGLTSVKTDPV
jgi:hypothetical protein